jgi:hypothetical protein
VSIPLNLPLLKSSSISLNTGHCPTSLTDISSFYEEGSVENICKTISTNKFTEGLGINTGDSLFIQIY